MQGNEILGSDPNNKGVFVEGFGTKAMYSFHLQAIKKLWETRIIEIS